MSSNLPTPWGERAQGPRWLPALTGYHAALRTLVLVMPGVDGLTSDEEAGERERRELK